MPQDPISTDPNFGLVSTDPNFGLSKGSERTRQDTNIIGIDHDKLKAMVGKWVDGLDPVWQKPAAIKAADFLGSLAEMFSAPETVATMGAKPALGAMEKMADAATAVTGKVVSARAPIGSAVETAGRFIQAPKKVVGEAIERAGTAIKGQPPAAPPTVPATVVTPPEALPAAAGMSPQRTLNELALAARRAGTKLTPEQEASALDLIKGGQSPTDAVSAIIPPTRSRAVGTLLKMATKPPADVSDTAIKLTAQEFQRGVDLLAQGNSAKEALAAILSARARGGSSAFAALPTDAEMTADLGQRAASGQKSLMPKYGPK